MEVAVLICCNDLVAFSQNEVCGGLGLRLEMLDLPALLGLQNDPLDIMLGNHGVLCAADKNIDLAAINSDNGNMLFNGCIGSAGNQLHHGLAAANHGDTAVLKLYDDIAADRASVEFKLH